MRSRNDGGLPGDRSASALMLDHGGDVMRPSLEAADPAARIRDLRRAHDILGWAIAAADHVIETVRDELTRAERSLWRIAARL